MKAFPPPPSSETCYFHPPPTLPAAVSFVKLDRNHVASYNLEIHPVVISPDLQNQALTPSVMSLPQREWQLAWQWFCLDLSQNLQFTLRVAQIARRIKKKKKGGGNLKRTCLSPLQRLLRELLRCKSYIFLLIYHFHCIRFDHFSLSATFLPSLIGKVS